MKRQAEITIDVGCEIKLVSFESHETIGRLFEIDANVIAAAKVDFLPSLGKPVLIELFELGQRVRVFHALLSEAHFLDEANQGYHYALKLRPWLHLLAHNRTNRIFEDMTGLDIIKQVLAPQSRHVDYSLITGTYLPRPYTTQYRESDHAFLARIMEREGIYYYFDHRDNDHVMMLCDAPAAHHPAPGFETVLLRPDHVGRNGGLTQAIWRWHEHVRSDGKRKVSLQSFDYQTTSIKHGQADGGTRNPADTQEIQDFTGDFVEEALAAHWARVEVEAIHARQRLYTGEGDTIALFCGCRFNLDSSDAFDRGRSFLVTALHMKVDAEPFRTGHEAAARHVRLEAALADQPWRSAPETPAPRAGPETAMVVMGGADDTHVDPLGRVRVRFPWGTPGNATELARSCWLRISESSAGAGFGHVALPRLNEEVIVTFLDGNPDRPLITGRVYNSRHTHPYALPEHRTRSLYRSRSIGPSGDYGGAEQPPPAGPGYNELCFEDKGGAEQVYLRAQRNRLAEIMLDDEARIRRDRKTRIGRDRLTQIHRNETVEVETGDYTLSIAQGSASIAAMDRITLAVGANSLTIDQTGIRLQVGLNTIALSEIGITLDGLSVTSTATTTQTITGALTTITAEGLLSLIGKPPLIA
ncbi:type VI secretion system tip protein TssI/VgrG [Novosphingobium sp.]|uniref:type VI secretion system Vgr family protein n=1 Tax=Novosphingobium sp. TaxID=1874826 RepID=UPI0031CF7195